MSSAFTRDPACPFADPPASLPACTEADCFCGRQATVVSAKVTALVRCPVCEAPLNAPDGRREWEWKDLGPGEYRDCACGQTVRLWGTKERA